MNVAKGTIRDILVIRLRRGDDMMGSIKEACLAHGVKNAVIISMVGSLNGATYYDPRFDPNDKSGISYGAPLVLESPAELLTAQGEICHREDGELSIHIHATFADSKGRAVGGHIIGEGNKCLNTLNIFIGVIDGVDMGFAWDEVLGMPAFCPKEVAG